MLDDLGNPDFGNRFGKSVGLGAATFDQVMKTGTFFDTVVERASNWPLVLGFLGVMNYGFIFSMMCLGVVAGRCGLLDNPNPKDTLWKRCRYIGLILGLPLGIVSGLFSQEIGGIAVGFGSAPLLTAGYLGFLVALFGKFPQSLSFFESAGRMSLTCYLFESILLSVIFCGWGLGFFGTLGTAAVAGVAGVVWLLIEIGARLWLRHHATGPFERLVAHWSSSAKH